MEILHHSTLVEFGPGMDFQPPWASELRARNRKVARNIWSTSDLPDRRTFTLDYERGHGGLCGGGKVVDPVSVATVPSTTKARGETTVGTERPAPIRDSSFEEAKNDMKETYPNVSSSGEESILEYGPGIVRKLRSKYQSLALRNIALRPSLRRSTSLENGLDLDTASTTTATPEPRIESPSPVPVTEPDSKAYRGTMTLNIRSPPAGGIQRGRAADINRQNRMRRARSVDALHHGEFTRHEEEILEKFKTVVLPKEEVVIIEVSKPRVNLSSLHSNTVAVNDVHSSSTPYVRSSSVGVGNNSGTDFPRRRSLTSPEHELPPHDIVRDTARIFETNSGNLWRRVGLALRLNKSSSASPSESLCHSPVSPSPIPSVDKKSYVSEQGSALLSNNHYAPHKEESHPKVMNNNMANNLHNAALNLSNNYGSPTATKQVGIIRPTMNGVTQGVVPAKVTPSTGVAPVPLPRSTTSDATVNKALQFVNYRKPALSPKPVFPTPAVKPGEKITEKKTVVEPSPSLSQSSIATPASSHQHVTIRREKSPEPSLQVQSKLSRSRSPSPMFPPKDIIRPYSPVLPAENEHLPNRTTRAAPSSFKLDAGISVQSNKENDSSTKSNQFPVTLKPVTKVHESIQQGPDITKTNSVRPIPEPNKTVPQKTPNKEASPTTTNTTLKPNAKPALVSSPMSMVKEGDVLKNKRIQSAADTLVEKQEQPASQLRTHQKQKSSQQTNGAGGTMVFNFTSRNKVPDYIEDDGLDRTGRAAPGSSEDAVDSSEWDRIDPKLINFIGANVIINGKSSIQKKPKSQKMSIKFNVDGITTFEYPSESSVLSEEEPTNSAINNTLLGQKSPNNVMGSTGGLGSYTPSKVTSSLYQLGTYKENLVDTNNAGRKPSSDVKTNRKVEGDVIEDYLKPDTESTTWSNEIGAADILF